MFQKDCSAFVTDSKRNLEYGNILCRLLRPMESSALLFVFCGFMLQLTPIIRFHFATQPIFTRNLRESEFTVWGFPVSWVNLLTNGRKKLPIQDLLKKKVYRKSQFCTLSIVIVDIFGLCDSSRRGLRKAKKKPWHTKGPYFFLQPPRPSESKFPPIFLLGKVLSSFYRTTF